MNGLKLFLDRVRASKPDPETRDAMMVDHLNLLLDIIENEVDKQADANPEFMLTAIRCFLLMLQMRELEDFNFHRIFERLVALFNFCNNFLRKHENPELGKMAQQMIVACTTKEMLQSTILKFQSYISIVIIEKIINQQMM